MRKIILALIPLFFTLQVKAQNIEGTWEGLLNVGKEIKIIFHFAKNADGSYKGSMDVPAQNAKGIAVTKTTIAGDSLTATINAANITYKALLVNDSTLNGKWSQGGGSVPLVLKHTVQPQAAEVIKPQTPLPPFSYNSDDVEYDNADKSVHFGATLTYPKTGGSFPAAILITGSGQQDRDETIFGHKPFAVLADYLSKKGYAVLRIDDRGIGKTTGSLDGVTSADFAADVEAAIAYLKTRADINKAKIGLIGHSEGGVIAPMVAAKHPELNFMVLWAGPVIGGLQTNVEQNAWSLKKAGIDSTAIMAFKSLHTSMLKLFEKAPNITALNPLLRHEFDTWKQLQPPAVLQNLYVGDTSVVGQSIYSMYSSLYNNAWMRFFIIHNFAADLTKVHCSVLAINGDMDKQVDAETNLSAIDAILRKNNNRHFKTVTLKGLNHLLQPAVTGDVAEYGSIPTTIAPEALQTIGNWMDENVMNKK